MTKMMMDRGVQEYRIGWIEGCGRTKLRCTQVQIAAAVEDTEELEQNIPKPFIHRYRKSKNIKADTSWKRESVLVQTLKTWRHYGGTKSVSTRSERAKHYSWSWKKTYRNVSGKAVAIYLTILSLGDKHGIPSFSLLTKLHAADWDEHGPALEDIRMMWNLFNTL